MKGRMSSLHIPTFGDRLELAGFELQVGNALHQLRFLEGQSKSSSITLITSHSNPCTQLPPRRGGACLGRMAHGVEDHSSASKLQEVGHLIPATYVLGPLI